MSAAQEEEIDHYEVLCLPSGEEGSRQTIEQIEKAYRTQSRLRHPDKRPEDPNATADFQRLSSSYNLLRDDSLRRQFDARLRARREAAARAAAAGVKRRKAISDLEDRERAAASAAAVDHDEAARREDKRKAADVKRELDEFFASKQASVAASTSAQGDASKANEVKTDKSKILKVSREGAADYYTAAKLEDIFKQFGKVDDIVIRARKSRSRGSAIVSMASKDDALAVLENHAVYNVFSVPLTVALVQESGGFSARSTQTYEPKASNIEGVGFNDLEASVFRKLQQAQKRKQSG